MALDSSATQVAGQIDPTEDGVTHVNVYSRGATQLGRSLSNFSECNIVHPHFGQFRTLEGLWYYMKTGFTEDELRVTNGKNTRETGKKLTSQHYPLFSKMFKLGMLEKLDRNPQLQQALIANELPLEHYYVYGGKVFSQERHRWQLDYWTLLRSTLQNTGSLDLIRNELEEEIAYHLTR